MKKVEAPTLEEAYTKASKLLDCSISELECEVIQHPSDGILGFMKKKAIIIAVANKVAVAPVIAVNTLAKAETIVSAPEPIVEEIVAEKIVEVILEEVIEKEVIEEKIVKEEVKEKIKEEVTVEAPKDAILDAFFEPEESLIAESIVPEAIEEVYEEENIVYDELALMIENQIKELFSHLCFKIDVVEVDVRDNTALIFIDGEDAALLIGKEGYRYNALSYMLFNWLHSKYELFIKLEIAEFLTKQQEMIVSYLKPVIVNVEKNGKGRTGFLDGILVQIALEQLRERFPDKYIAIKTGKEGKKFVVINAFNSPSKPKIKTQS